MKTNRLFNRNLHSFRSFCINEALSQAVQVTPEIIDFVKNRTKDLLWDEEYGLLVKKEPGESLPWTEEEKASHQQMLETDPEEARLLKKRIDQKYRFSRTRHSVKGMHVQIWSPEEGVPEFVVVKVSRNDWELFDSKSPIAQEIYEGDYKTEGTTEADLVDVGITFFDKSDGMVDEFGNYEISFEIHIEPKGTFARGTVEEPEEAQSPEERIQAKYARKRAETPSYSIPRAAPSMPE